MEHDLRTAAIVHLDRLAANLENIRSRLAPGVEIMAVVKADAYGHGITGVYPTLRRGGVKSYAVSYWEDGAALRLAGAAEEPILLLADAWDGHYPKLIEHRLTPAIYTLEAAEKLDALAASAGLIQSVQIKIETGMNRIGFPPTEAARESICRIAAMEHLKITGAFTHFAKADELDDPATDRQLEKFLKTVAALRERGVDIPMVHVANSPAILLRPETHLDAVRAGDALFGLCPVDETIWPDQGLREVMTWETYVAYVKTVPAGQAVGYGGTFVTERETVIATMPVGFADGYSRHLSNRGKVRIRGHEAPIIGRVCMEQFMADVTDIPGVKRGDTVHLLDDKLTILWMADLLETNVDEIVCGIDKRVPRIYVDENR